MRIKVTDHEYRKSGMDNRIHVGVTHKENASFGSAFTRSPPHRKRGGVDSTWSSNFDKNEGIWRNWGLRRTTNEQNIPDRKWSYEHLWHPLQKKYWLLYWSTCSGLVYLIVIDAGHHFPQTFGWLWPENECLRCFICLLFGIFENVQGLIDFTDLRTVTHWTR